MRIPSIKTVVTVLAIIEVWLLLQVPSIGDLLFNFVVGGELPGSDKVLSPTQMMLFLMGIFVLAAGLIFKKEIIAAAQKANQPAVVAAPVQKPVQPAPVVQKVRKVRKPRQWPAPMAIAIPYMRKLSAITQAFKAKIYAYVLRFWAAAYPKLSAWQSAVRLYVRRAASATQKGVIWFCVTELYLMYRLWIATKAYSIAVWTWLRPHIERCDRWIERKLRQNTHASTLLEMGAEFAGTVRAWIVRIRAMLSQ